MHQALIIPLFLFLTATPDGEPSTQEEQVRCAETTFSDSVEFGDWDAFERLVHAEARFAAGSSPARVGAAVIRERWERSYSGDDRSLRWRSRSVEIIRPGELALSRGPYRLRVRGEDGEINEIWGTFNSIWIREGSGWQVAFDLGSDGTEEGDRELIGSGAGECPEAPQMAAGTPPLQARPFFFALSVQDVERSRSWYERVFGFSTVRATDMEERSARIRLLSGKGAFLELVELSEAGSGAEFEPPLEKRQLLHGVFKFGFEVDHLDETLARLEALEVTLRGTVITESDGTMRSAQVLDPDGNIIQLFQILD